MSREGEWGKWKAGRSKTQESTILRVTSYLCPTPQGWGVTGDGRAYLSVKTPPTVGFDVWNRTVEKLRGVVKCDVELRRLAADRVAIVTPPRAARMTPGCLAQTSNSM